MPPLFFVPFADKTDAGVSPEEALKKSHGPASGGQGVFLEEYTNIHKALDTVLWNAIIGRAKKSHQSPWNLSLHVHLLSLWWKPERIQKLDKEQEFLARPVFFDVVEGAHLAPLMYAHELRAAGALASTTGGASAASGMTPQEPPAAASGAAGSSAHGVLLVGGAPSALTGAPQQHASGGDPQSSGGAAATAAPARGPRSSLIGSRLTSAVPSARRSPSATAEG